MTYFQICKCSYTLIKLHLFKYYIAPTLISIPLQCVSCVQTHSKYYEMSGLRDRNICNCIDIEEGWVLGCCTSADNPYHAMTMGFRQVQSRYWAIIKALVQAHNYGLGGAHRDKNGWSSLWQKWVELSMTKIGGNFMDKLLIFFLWRCQTLNKMLLVKSRVSQFLQVIISSDNCVYFSQLGDTIDRFMKRSKQGLPWARCWGCGRVGVQPELGWHLGQVSSPLCDFPFKIRLRILI